MLATLSASLDSAARERVEQHVKPNVEKSNTDMNMFMHARDVLARGRKGGRKRSDKTESRCDATSGRGQTMSREFLMLRRVVARSQRYR